MRITVAAMTAVALLGAAGAAQAQGMPQPVMGTIREMDDLCRQVGGTPGDRSGLILTTDITGDGVRDWIVDQANYQCEGSAGLYAGSRGGTILIFRGMGSGAAQPEEFNAFGVRLTDDKVWLSVAGNWCDQTVTENTATVDLAHCERQVIWTGDHFDVGDYAQGSAPSAPAAPVAPVTGKPLPAPMSPRPSAAPAVKPGPTSGNGAGTAGSTPAWFAGAWVGEGNYCDSGEPVALLDDGTLMNELFSGTWSVDGDVLVMTTRGHDDDGQPVGAWQTARYRVERLDDNRAEWVPLDGGPSHIALRCPHDGH